MSKEERKYEIAEKETMGIFDPHELDITGLSNAMDIYAKEVAIEFAEWAAKNGWYFNKIQRWSNRSDKSEELLLVLANTKSTEQLYELFLQSQKQ